jgi:hypothetical protein
MEERSMPAPYRPTHDRTLFDRLVDGVRASEPELRVGAMFGCPAAFVGRRLAFCVYGDVVGARIPEGEAARVIAAGEAATFRPYGRPAGKQWVALRTEPEGAQAIAPILGLAVRHAKDLA